MFASASFPSLVVGKWPCLLEIGSGRRNQRGNHGSKRFYFVCRWRTVCQQVPYIRGAQLWKFTRCPATVYQHTGLQKVDSSFCTLARKNSKTSFFWIFLCDISPNNLFRGFKKYTPARSNPRVSCDDKQKLSMWEQFSYFLYTYLNIIDIYLIFQWRPTTSVSAKQSRDRLLGH